MIIRDIKKCEFFEAMDGTTLCELMHPAREDLGIPYSIAYAILKPGTASLPHALKESSEVYFILEGEGIVHVAGESSWVGPGQAILIPPGSEQYAEATGTEDFKFLCLVYPFWREDDEICRGSG